MLIIKISNNEEYWNEIENYKQSLQSVSMILDNSLKVCTDKYTLNVNEVKFCRR